MKARKIEGQQEFDFDDCYLSNYPPLDLSKYEGDRNYEFYRLQNELLMDYNKTGKTNKEILWKMYPYIEGVVESLAKKNICIGCNVPDFFGKSLEASLKIMGIYERDPYFRAQKLENVAFQKVQEVFLNGHLKLNERARDYDNLLEMALEKEKTDKRKNVEEKTVGELRQEKLEKQEMKEITDFHNWQIRHKRR